MSPIVSVGLPVYNGEAYLTRAFESLLAQDFGDFELIVSDNGSTDASPQIIDEFARSDARVRVHRFESNRGAAANYNKTFGMARGHFFTWAAHDDLYDEQFLSRCVSALQAADDDVVLVYTRSRFIDEHESVLSDDEDRLELVDSRPAMRLARFLDKINMANPVFGLFRTDVLAKTRLIDSFVASDYVLLAEIALLGKIKEIPDFLFFRRVHPDSSRKANRTDQEVAKWFDPDRKAPRMSTRSRLLLEYHRSINQIPLPFLQKAICHCIVPTVHFARRGRVLVGRYRRTLFSNKG